MKHVLLLAALVSILLQSSAINPVPNQVEKEVKKRESCPIQCQCTEDTAVCKEWSLTKENTSIPAMPKISGLSIYRWPRERIEMEGTNGLTTLHFLKISNSALKMFPKLPSSVSQLSFLDLSQNKISSLPPKACENVTYITHLNISRNSINHIDGKFLEGLHELMIFDLSHNPIMQLNELIFYPTRRLGFLDLSHTLIEEIKAGHVHRLQNLYYLDLSWNNIKLLPKFPKVMFEVLDLSHNPLTHLSIGSMSRLQKLDISHTHISSLIEILRRSPNINYLDASFTNLTNINVRMFRNCHKLQELYLRNNNIEFLKNDVFYGLSDLLSLNLENCEFLREFEDEVFNNVLKLEKLSLQNTAIEVLPKSLRMLNYLTDFNIQNTSIQCDCHAHWLPEHFLNVSLTGSWKGFNPINCRNSFKMTVIELEEYLYTEQCTPVTILSPRNKWVLASAGQSALLECNATGEPRPDIIWQTVDHRIIVLNKTERLNTWVNRKISKTITMAELDKDENKFQVLESGQLLIRNVQRKDIGRYKCFAYNAVSNSSYITFMGLDATSTRAFFVETALFGWAFAALFLLVNLIIQFIKYILDRLGCECCCCRDRLSPKAKQIRQLLETVENYKSAQLERLRENYNCQVVGIKDSCYFQMEKVRDSYGTQTKNLRSLRDNSYQQISGARDQYLDQVQCIRDYSMGQMGRVRENYVFQRQRIRKFSAHQLIKLRETYKYQQKTLNKLLETLPDLYIQNCRTGQCQRSDSIMFDELDDLDIYYKVDFLDGHSFGNNSSDYYTPNSTLSKNFKKRYLSKSHSRNGSSESGDTQNNVTVHIDNEVNQTLEEDKPHRRFHLRSFSLISPPIKVHRTPSKGHKRSISATNPHYQSNQQQCPLLEESSSPPQASTSADASKQDAESNPYLPTLQMVQESKHVSVNNSNKLSKSDSTLEFIENAKNIQKDEILRSVSDKTLGGV